VATLDCNDYRMCHFYRELFVSTSLRVSGKWIPTVQRLSKARAFSRIFVKTEGAPLIQSRTTSRYSLDLHDNKTECRQKIIRIYTRRRNGGLEIEYIDREKNEYPGFTY
jgi:hypothetical protein